MSVSNVDTDQLDRESVLLHRLVEEQSRTNALLERLIGAIENADRLSNEEEVLVGIRAICDALGVSENTLRQMRHEGGLPIFKLPGDNRWRISKTAMNLWISRRAER